MKTILLLVFPGNNLKWNILMYFTENPYLTKVFFSSCGSKCSWPIILRILWSVICQERIKFPTSSILLCVCVCVCVRVCVCVCVLKGGVCAATSLSPSRQVFPLWGPFFPAKFLLLPMKVLVSQSLPEMGYWCQKSH